MTAVRAELKTLIAAWTATGYTYTGACYREIAMENSNYGGMENVGNTTIISSRLTPSRSLFLLQCSIIIFFLKKKKLTNERRVLIELCRSVDCLRVIAKVAGRRRVRVHGGRQGARVLPQHQRQPDDGRVAV